MGQSLNQLVARHKDIREQISALIGDQSASNETAIRELDEEMSSTFSSIVSMEIHSPDGFGTKVEFLCDCLIEYSQDNDIVENIAKIIQQESENFAKMATVKGEAVY